MVFSWLSGTEDVSELIAKRNYARAAKILRAQLEKEPGNTSLQSQLADVLAFDGKTREAVEVLLRVADEFAVEGFVGKAIAVLKRVQRLDPGRTGVEERLARLVKERDEETTLRHRLRQGGGRMGRDDSAARTAARAPLPDPAVEFEVTLPGEAEPEAPTAARAATAQEARPGDDTAVTRPIIASTPLFGDFSTAELLAVIRGLQLKTFEPGDVIVAEGEPGDSLFVLTTGTVKAFVKDPAGHYHKVREMYEGAFFGEVSILTGKPRSATITAATPCELLELDRPTLDGITERQPNVRDILVSFCEARLGSADELLIRSGRSAGTEAEPKA